MILAKKKKRGFDVFHVKSVEVNSWGVRGNSRQIKDALLGGTWMTVTHQLFFFLESRFFFFLRQIIDNYRRKGKEKL